MNISIIGGGLWGGMLAWMIHRKRPDVSFTLYEENKFLGGNHTWSFHKNDLSDEDFKLISPLVTYSWPGYDVKFPSYSKFISLEYCTITSEHFDQVIRRTLPMTSLKLGESIQEMPEGLVFDLRGSNYDGDCGYQKFVGLEVITETPHGLMNPIIMDAQVRQLDGFRFIYYLPFTEDRILIEDTRYSETSELDSHEILKELLHITREKGWKIREIVREEKGSLPIPFKVPELTFDHHVFKLQNIFHDTTGYSLPDAVKIASGITETNLDKQSIRQFLEHYVGSKQNQRKFFTLLNRLMFQAASNEDRYKPLEFFYRSNETQISKFYRAEMSTFDQLKFFAGRPPVSLSKALEVIIKDGF